MHQCRRGIPQILTQECALGAGMVYVIDVLMNFQIGMVLTKSMHARLVLEGRMVAHLYICRGTFILDAIASLPVWPEVGSHS